MGDKFDQFIREWQQRLSLALKDHLSVNKIISVGSSVGKQFGAILKVNGIPIKIVAENGVPAAATRYCCSKTVLGRLPNRV